MNELILIQMSNINKAEYALYTGQTPYINYKEFIKELKLPKWFEENSIINTIKWKCKEYNRIVCVDIERQIQILRWSLHISISNAEHIIFCGGSLNKKLWSTFRRRSESTLNSPWEQKDDTKISNKIYTSEVRKYITEKDGKSILDLPEAEAVKITIDDEDAYKIDQNIYWFQQQMYLDTKDWDNNLANNKKIMLTKISDFHNQMKKNIYDSIIDKDKINKAKIKYKIEFELKVAKSLEILESFIRKTFENSKDFSNDFDLSYKYIPDYPWMNISNMVSNFKNLKKDVMQRKYVHKEPFLKKSSDSFADSFKVIAENIFGSFSRLWIADEKNESDSSISWYKIKKRHESIQYLIQNIQLDHTIAGTYCKELLSFLENEVKMNTKTKSGEFKVGCYNRMDVDLKLIKRFPFEIWIGINSTLARIHTLSKWNEITSWPQFLRQTSFGHVFGFVAKDLNSFYSKKFFNFFHLF